MMKGVDQGRTEKLNSMVNMVWYGIVWYNGIIIV